MAKFDRFLIAPFDSGLQTNLKSWLLPEDAFSQLNNAYVWRGRVRKRFGSRFMGTGWSDATTEQLFSRLRINLGNTIGGALSGTVPGNIFAIGQSFSVGDTILTVYNSTPGVQDMLTTGTITGTYDVSTGDFAITGGVGAVPVWWYPGTPVMGFANYSPTESINDQPSYAFDQQFAYLFAGGFWQQSVGSFWQGSDINFFWPCNWLALTGLDPLLFVTNYHVLNYNGPGDTTDDPIWYLQDSTWTPALASNGFYFLPAGGSKYTGPFIQTARLIVQFKNRLVLLNTVENSGSSIVGTTTNMGAQTGNTAGGVVGQYFVIGTTKFTIITTGNAANPLEVSPGGTGTGTYNTVTGAWTFTGASISSSIFFFNGTNKNYASRARFSHFGSPLSVNAWYESGQKDSSGNVGDGGGYVDAATEEEIISCEFVKDRLIVYFERSTWALVYNNNQVKPFTWQKINTELGSESQFSTIPFDTQAITIGNTGVHACNGANVQRIDNKIPQKVFQISNKNIGIQRVAGIRDYFAEMVYWCFPENNENNADTYPNKVLVYNYQNGSWSFNDDCITAFGYFEQQQGVTWSSTTTTWQESNFAWNSGTVSIATRQVIAGNQQGFVFIVDVDEGRNERAMQITQISDPTIPPVTLTIINHNLDVGDFISVENSGGILPVLDIYEVLSITDSNNVIIDTRGLMSGTYTGGGNAARVSNIMIQSKQWNPYVDKDRNVFVQRIDFGVLRTESGEITVDYSPSSSTISLLQDGGSDGTGAIMGTGILETSPYDASLAPLEQTQEHLWHPLYFQTDGTCIQILMSFSTDQILNPAIAWDDFELQGICLYTQPTTSRLN